MDLDEISKYAVKHFNVEDGEIEEIVTNLMEVIDSPLTLSEVLEDFISQFPQDQVEVDKLFGIQRWSFINLRFCFFLFFYEYPISDKDSINDILMIYKPMIEEHKNYWAHKFCVLPESNETNKQLDSKFKLEQIEEGFYNLTEKIKSLDNTKPILSEVTKLLIYDLLIILGNVNDFSSNAQIEKVNSIVYDSLVYIKEHLFEENDIKYIDSFISMFEDDTEPKAKETETLANLICHSESQNLVNSLKIQYKNIGGKRLKILFLCLQELGLIPKENVESKFHRLCKNEFDWDIKSYSAMNDYRYNSYTDKSQKESMLSFLKSTIKTT